MLFSYEVEKVFVIPEKEEDLYEASFCLIKQDDKVGNRDVNSTNIKYFFTF